MIGCKEGIGKGKFLKYGAGGGAGHGGRGGIGIYNGMRSEGGPQYGSADLPCELGSGSGSSESTDNTAGGGLIGRYHLLFVILYCSLLYPLYPHIRCFHANFCILSSFLI